VEEVALAEHAGRGLRELAWIQKSFSSGLSRACWTPCTCAHAWQHPQLVDAMPLQRAPSATLGQQWRGVLERRGEADLLCCTPQVLQPMRKAEFCLASPDVRPERESRGSGAPTEPGTRGARDQTISGCHDDLEYR
jgi:hypothetical protein